MQQAPPGPVAQARAGTGFGRRRLMQAAAAGGLVAASRIARAATTDLSVACDNTLGPALRLVAEAYRQTYGVRVDVFPTPPGLILPQLQREVQNDVVVTQRVVLDAAISAGLITPNAVRGAWRNQVILAERRDAARFRSKPIAVTDPSPATDMDGPYIMEKLGVPAGDLVGVIDTETVVALVLAGAARSGLMHMSDFKPHATLQMTGTIPADLREPVVYRAAVTELTRRPHPEVFTAFMTDTVATRLLATFGLETPL